MPNSLISDRVWDRIREAAKEILNARSDDGRQDAVRGMHAVLQRELDLDMGTPW
jgi:hypothetical protein